jgi:hypothetical protein
MQSNVIKITRDQEALKKILCETQKTAVYADLNDKQTLRTRLIAEELIGMLKELSEDFDGDFVVDLEDLTFKFITHIDLNETMDKQTKRKFIDISSEKQNAAAKGVMGKIRDIVENMRYSENAVYSADFVAHQLETAVLMDDTWTLSRYKDAQKDNAEPWDELEKSIIANLADDVIVSVKGNKIEIVIVKKFN